MNKKEYKQTGEKASRSGKGKSVLGISKTVFRRSAQENRPSLSEDTAGSRVGNSDAPQPKQRIIVERVGRSTGTKRIASLLHSVKWAQPVDFELFVEESHCEGQRTG